MNTKLHAIVYEFKLPHATLDCEKEIINALEEKLSNLKNFEYAILEVDENYAEMTKKMYLNQKDEYKYIEFYNEEDVRLHKLIEYGLKNKEEGVN